jgi:hypothetical protein
MNGVPEETRAGDGLKGRSLEGCLEIFSEFDEKTLTYRHGTCRDASVSGGEADAGKE